MSDETLSAVHRIAFGSFLRNLKSFSAGSSIRRELNCAGCVFHKTLRLSGTAPNLRISFASPKCVALGRVERKFRGSGPANFAVRPYSSQCQHHLEVKDGWRVFVRPSRPEGEPLIHEFLRHVTSHDLRLRFFAPMKEFSHEFIARLTQLDYARAMAFLAFDEVAVRAVHRRRRPSASVAR